MKTGHFSETKKWAVVYLPEAGSTALLFILSHYRVITYTEFTYICFSLIYYTYFCLPVKYSIYCPFPSSSDWKDVRKVFGFILDMEFQRWYRCIIENFVLC